MYDTYNIPDFYPNKVSTISMLQTIEGDVNYITIGDAVTVGDRVMVHVSGSHTQNKPTIVGNRVVIDSGAILHGCTVEDECMIGAGALLMDGAVVKSHSIVAAGSILPRNKVVPSGELWAGCPATKVRDLTATEVASIAKTALENVELASVHAQETAKSWEEIAEDEYNYEQKVRRNESYYKRLTPEQMSFKLGELENHAIPGRVFDSAGMSWSMM
jgi:gamma-carbonic anhydrase